MASPKKENYDKITAKLKHWAYNRGWLWRYVSIMRMATSPL